MRNSFGIYPNTFDLLIESLRKFEEIEKATFFGSRAMGNYKEGSDIDIAIEGAQVSIKTISKLSQLLNDELPIPYFIDIIDLNKIETPGLIDHIKSEGKVIYTRN